VKDSIGDDFAAFKFHNLVAIFGLAAIPIMHPIPLVVTSDFLKYDYHPRASRWALRRSRHSLP
jgi:hypothetical protein